MRIAVMCRLLGQLLMLFSLLMLVPAALSWYDQDQGERAFVLGFLITAACGGALWFGARGRRAEIRTRDGFALATLFWVLPGAFGALPLLLALQPVLDPVDALFESISGLTTTGATVLSGLDTLPRSILLYRHLLQWLGGLGIIVIAVAILPVLGIGGMQLYQADTPAAIKGNKLNSRISGTAGALFLIYLGLSLACALGYWLAGMSLFDALCHSMSTVSLGGFSTHDANMGYFANPAILAVCAVFMLISALNFILHYLCWKQGSPRVYFRDPETGFFLLLLATLVLVTVVSLLASAAMSPAQSVLQGAFHAISVLSTGGFTTAHFGGWPATLAFLLLMFACLGGCGSSTSGGIKMIRALLIYKQGLRELRQLVHPNAIVPVRLGRRTIPDRVIIAVWSFLAIYVLTFITILLGLLLAKLDFVTAFSAVLATLNNLGPALGEASAHYGALSTPAKLLLCVAMLLGRLEIFTVLVLFTPAFWRD